MKKRFFCHLVPFFTLFLVIIMLLTVNSVFVCAETDAKITNTDICVVYDNSGSTYQDETWCRYKYVLEIMASLVDYDNGGRLFIYPLCDVSLDGRESSASCEPISIVKYADIGKISNMFTTAPANTPFEPVEDAYNYLINESSADDKRLVILTDGMFNGFASAKEFETRLLQMAKHSRINIHYFGSGDAVHISSKESEGLYSYCMSGLVDTQQLLDFTTDLCGVVFNQTQAISSKSQLTNITVDANSKVIVFANGKASTVLGLKNNNGVAIPFLYDTGRHKYSTTKAVGFSNAPIDTKLESYISIFECAEAGEYTLDCKNSELVNIYVQQDDNVQQDDKIGSDSIVSKENHNPSITRNLVIVTIVVVLIILFLTWLFWNKYSKKERKKYQIFISYRRDGGDALAGRLADRFTLMGYKTFYDVESMRSGVFNEQIYKAIDECQDVLIILPPNALDRCINESDWVRKEIIYAIKKEKNIIPIMMRGFEFPETLPVEIDMLRFMEGVTASNEYFDAVIDKIEGFLCCKKK